MVLEPMMNYISTGMELQQWPKKEQFKPVGRTEVAEDSSWIVKFEQSVNIFLTVFSEFFHFYA